MNTVASQAISGLQEYGSLIAFGGLLGVTIVSQIRARRNASKIAAWREHAGMDLTPAIYIVSRKWSGVEHIEELSIPPTIGLKCMAFSNVPALNSFIDDRITQLYTNNTWDPLPLRAIHVVNAVNLDMPHIKISFQTNRVDCLALAFHLYRSLWGGYSVFVFNNQNKVTKNFRQWRFGKNVALQFGFHSYSTATFFNRTH